MSALRSLLLTRSLYQTSSGLSMVLFTKKKEFYYAIVTMYSHSLCNSNNKKMMYLLSIGQVAQKRFYLLFYYFTYLSHARLYLGKKFSYFIVYFSYESHTWGARLTFYKSLQKIYLNYFCLVLKVKSAFTLFTKVSRGVIELIYFSYKSRTWNRKKVLSLLILLCTLLTKVLLRNNR